MLMSLRGAEVHPIISTLITVSGFKSHLILTQCPKPILKCTGVKPILFGVILGTSHRFGVQIHAQNSGIHSQKSKSNH